MYDQNDIDLTKEINFTEHLMNTDDLESKFQTNLNNGLSAKEADLRYLRDGPNAFTPPKQKSNWLILLKELTGGFAWIMVCISYFRYSRTHTITFLILHDSGCLALLVW